MLVRMVCSPEEVSDTIELLEQTLLSYENALRQSGRTMRIVQKGQDTGAIMVCPNYPHANQVTRDFGIKTVSLETYMSPDYLRGAKSVKHIFDHFAEFVLIQQKLKEMESIINGSLDTNYTRF